MKEQLIYTDDGDPLSTLPPFGGAEAKPQNSEEKPDFTPNDFSYISKVIEAEAASRYPLDAPWTEPIGLWAKTLSERSYPMSNANITISRYFEETRGPESDIAISTRILSNISLDLNKIASTQFEQMSKAPRSWSEANQSAASSLYSKLDQTLNDRQNQVFFDRNHSIREGLILMKDVLIKSDKPDFIYEKHSEYIKSCIDANSRGEIIFYMPFESDFTNPIENESERTQVCEALCSVVLPMQKHDRIKFNEQAEAVWDILKRRKNAHKVNSRLNIIIGTNVMGAGFEALDTAVAESFVFKSGSSHEHGFYLAVNNLAKKSDFWLASNDLIDLPNFDSFDIFYKNSTFLHVIHEEGHIIFPEYGQYGEVSTDIPSVVNSFKIGLNPNILHTKDQKPIFGAEEMVKSILTEYVSEVINNVSETAWFEGGRANSGNKLYDGYLLSAVLIVNALASSGIVRANYLGKIDLNLGKTNIDKLFSNLAVIDSKFHEGNKKTLKKIRGAVANPEARKIIELYRQKIKEIQFTQNTSLPLEMNSKADTL